MVQEISIITSSIVEAKPMTALNLVGQTKEAPILHLLRNMKDIRRLIEVLFPNSLMSYKIQ